MSLCWFYVDDSTRHQTQFLQGAGGALTVEPHQVQVAPPAAAVHGKVVDVMHHPANLDTQLLSTISTSPFVLSNMQDMKVNWQYLPALATLQATTPPLPKPDTSKHFHIFVGDLCPYLQTYQLKDAFEVYGQISDCKIIQDPQTMRSKGYGFVTFVKKDDAAKAINAMNGKQLGSRVIRTNWAMRKLSLTGTTGKLASYDEVYGQSSAVNSTVYCGGIMTGLTDDIIRKAFCSYGTIEEIRVFEEKGYAFIRFSSKEAATEAIIKSHLTQINGHIVKCSWGKKGEDIGSQLNSPTALTTTTTTASLHNSSSPASSVSPAQQPHQLGLGFQPALGGLGGPAAIGLGIGVQAPTQQFLQYDRPMPMQLGFGPGVVHQTPLSNPLQGYYIYDNNDCLSKHMNTDCSQLLPQQPTFGLCDYRAVQVPISSVTSQLPAAVMTSPLPPQHQSNALASSSSAVQSLGLVGLYTLQPVE